MTRRVATVFGGSGFIGRYVVRLLARAGHVVRVAVTDTEAAGFLKTMGGVGQIVPLRVSVTDAPAVQRAVDGADFVVNLVGILAEGAPGQFMQIQGEGAGIVARAAATAGARLVHVSAIGADANSASLYTRSKAAGEAAVLAAVPAAVILRPSVVFGPEDAFFNRFAGIAAMAPVVPVIGGDVKLQPVYVGDVAAAVMAGLARSEGGVFELGGPRVATLRALQAWILELIGRRKSLIDVPAGVAGLMASVMEKLPGKPLTTDQLKLLQIDNVVSIGAAGLSELGISPTPMEIVVPGYLQRYRRGG